MKRTKKPQQFVVFALALTILVVRYPAGYRPPAKTEALSHNPLLESDKRKQTGSQGMSMTTHTVCQNAVEQKLNIYLKIQVFFFFSENQNG